MSLDAQTAANIAARFGLGLDAAVSLRMLADTEAEAERIAAQFAPYDLDTSLARKAAALADLHRRTDQHGRIRPATDAPPASAAPVDVAALQSGAVAGPAPDDLRQRIADAEQAGDYQLAGALKAQQIERLRGEMEQQ